VKVTKQERGKGKPHIKRELGSSKQESKEDDDKEDSDGKSPFPRKASCIIGEVVNHISTSLIS
jgi:hypothetical protein